MTAENDVRDLWPSTVHDAWMSPSFEEGLVSVIVPTYNRAHLLTETLDSVRAQTYRPIELIVVDDGSVDDSREVLRRWKADHETRDLRVRLFDQENAGAPAARNRGLIESRGEYIQYLDSDDLLHPQKLEIQVASARATSSQFVFSGVNTFSEDVALSRCSNQLTESASDLIQRTGRTAVMNIPHLASRGLYKRSLVVKVGPWNERLERWQDFEYNVRVSAQQASFVETRGDFHFWRQHSHGRIEDYRETGEGVAFALRTLSAVEKFLDHTDQDVNTLIKRPYLAVIREAMMEGTHQQANRAIHGMLRQDLSNLQTLGLKTIHIIYRLFGGSAAVHMMDAYPKVKSLIKL